MQSAYTFGVIESASVGSTLGLLVVIDNDASPNVQFSISSSLSDVFGITKTGEKEAVLTIAQPLDRETTPTYSFDVFAEEGGVTARTVVTVNIGDVNDVPPEFRQDKANFYTHTLPESLAEHAGEISIFNPFPYNVIYDPDLVSDPSFVFDREVDGFTLRATTGAIMVGNIDRERQSFYTFNLIYSDGMFNTSQQFNITITDINDEKPVFTQNFTRLVSIFENHTLSSQVAQFLATDADTAPNAIIRYKMTGIDDEMSVFNLDPITGILSLSQSLDYETKRSYTFFVSAHNVDQVNGQVVPGTTNEARQVLITILDNNDNPPVFTQDVYNVQVLDTSKINMQILQLEATDVDGPNDFKFTIVDGNELEQFTVDLMNGKVRVASDLKGASNTTLNVSVSSNQNQDRSYAAIHIIIVHSASSIFEKAQYMVTVDENSPPATLLNLNISSQPGVSIGFDDNDENHLSYISKFRFDETTGQLATLVPLNYEDASEYNLVIVATDGQSTSRALINVKVHDIDDEPPTVKSNMTGTFSVDEDAAVGTIVGIIEASDPDSAQLVFQISRTDPRTVFSSPLQSQSLGSVLPPLPFAMTSSGGVGYIIVTSPLDSTVEDMIQVFITVSDANENAIAQPIQRDITVTDVNDNAPTFNQTEYRFTVSENRPEGTTLGRVYGQDIDTNANLTYEIPGHGDTFLVTDTGAVVLRRSLDYETEKRFQFVVLVKDQSTTPPLIGITVVHVEVDPVFEFFPVFEEPFSYKISENAHPGSTVFTAVATSKDQCHDTTPCQMAYKLDNVVFTKVDGSLNVFQNDTYFSINSSTGQIDLLRHLDASEFVSAWLSVSTTYGPKTAVASYTVTVIDTNNNAPSFNSSGYTFIVPENLTIGSFIATIYATDKDMGLNGEVRYSIVQNEIGMRTRVPFAINQTTGAITTRDDVDYEESHMYDLLIQATDLGTPSPLSSFATLKIYIADKNDNPPVISPSVYQISISENTVIGQAIVTIQASDADSGHNGELIFRIVTVDPRFSVNETTGILRVNASLQSNTETSIRLNISVSDKEGLVSAQQALVIITVLQVGVSAPTFSQSLYTYSVQENLQGIQTLSPPLLVTDQDSVNIQLTAVTDVGFRNLFTIDQDTRRVIINQPLDYERVKKYHFIVTASDDSEPPNKSSCQVVVNVLDVDDNLPFFTTPIHISLNISEGTRVGQTLAIVSGHDADELSFPLIFKLHYFLNNTDRFSIHNRSNSMAEIRLKQPLECSQVTETLIVTLTDANGNMAATNATITINTIDSNNHCPVLPHTYQIVVFENANYTNLFPVRAIDNDCRQENKMIRYSIIQRTEHVSIDPITGFVSIVKPFDYENTLSRVEYTIVASDATKPSCQGVSRFIIDIANVNDNTPIFTSPSNVTVNENQRIGSVVHKVEVRDDDDENAMLLYSIIPSVNSSYFLITSDGSIILLRNLDFEVIKTILITVKVEDNFILPMQQATQQIRFTIRDVNDNKPIFTALEYQFQIPEEFSGGQLVGCVSAVDADSGAANGHVSYAIFKSSFSDSFTIDSDDGCIYTTDTTIDIDYIGHADRTSLDVSVFVSAHDGGTPHQLSSSTVVTVKVTNINDNSPVFTDTHLQENILETLTVGTTITRVQALDADRDTVYYRITGSGSSNGSSNEDDTFIVNQLTGVITLNRKLDYNAKQSYTFLIVATDSSIIDPGNNSSSSSSDSVNNFTPPPSYTNIINITINIINVDNHQPRFTKQNYTFRFSEQTPVTNAVLFTVEAVDLDGGQIGYSLSDPGSLQNPRFIINATTGEVRLVQQMDYETDKLIVLRVHAVNQNGAGDKEKDNQFTGSANVFIDVEDENDNRPVFETTTGSIQVPESTIVGTVVKTVIARDGDVGSNNNGQIKYKFAQIEVKLRDSGELCSQCLSPFGIDSMNGEIYLLEPLDAEKFESYKFKIDAEDSGQPALKAQPNIEITIVIINTNEHCPTFVQHQYNATVDEDMANGTFVIQVEAQDKDLASVITYTLRGSTHFIVNATSGVIHTSDDTLPDYRYQRVHDFFVTATDQLTPPCSASVPIRVFVRNINNNPPSVNVGGAGGQLSTFKFVENTPVGTVLFKVDATDLDDDPLSYRFLLGDSNNSLPFTINSTTGAVLLTSQLSYELQTFYQLHVEVTDGKFTITVSYNVFVTSVNDNEPKFERIHYIFRVTEEEPAGTFVGCVQGSDIESGRKLFYNMTYLYGSSSKRVFAMNSTTGCIKTMVPLDREESSRHFLRGYVYDSGRVILTDVATIEIVLDDINDNPPVVANLPTELFLTETTHVPSSLLVLQVTDKDYKSNQDIFLTWIGDRDMFNVEENHLVLIGQLDFEKVRFYY